MKKKNQSLLLGFVLLFTGAMRAADYYVDATSGNDSNNGTSSATAWQSLSKISAFTFLPGDNLFFKSGEIWNGQLSLNGSGSEGNPILLDKYGAGSKPIINGGGALTNSAATVFLHNVEYWEINNLEITNTNGTNGYQGDLWGILSELDLSGGMEAHHIYIRNCYIHDVNGNVATKTTGGIYMTAFGDDPTRYNDLKIENNEIDNVGGLGIANQSSHARINANPRYPSLNIKIRGNRISNTGRNNLIIRASDNSIVEHNTFANSSRYDTGHSVFCFNTESVKIQYNEAFGNTGSGDHDRGGYDADFNCKNTKIQYNYSHDNFWGFAIMKKSVNENVVIRYNISENDQKAIYFYGFEGQTGMTTASIYNNTHYVKAGIQVTVFGTGQYARTAIKSNFYNNIFYFESTGSTWGSSDNITFKNNSYYNIPALGKNYITSDPLLVNPNNGGQDIDWDNYPNVLTGYKLQSESPCIDAGRIIDDNGGQDFWGAPLYDGAADIGAGEYVKSGGGIGTENNIEVTEDSYIRGGNYSTTNYGGTISVRLKESSNESFARRGYLMFDLSSYTGSVETATLHVYGSAQQIMDMAVYNVDDDNWLENTITWDNAPSFGSSLGAISLDDADQWYVLDVTSAVQAELSGNSTLSLGLKDDNVLIKTIDLYSKENGNGEFKAYLSIQESEPINIPVKADALVRDGSYQNNNYGFDSELLVKLSSTNFTRESYLKFDVSSLATLGTISNATLVMEPSLASANAALTQIEVKSVSDDTWTETGITWSNKPTQGSILDSKTGSATTMEWDITSQVSTEVLGDGIISLSLSSTVSGSTHLVWYNSKESINSAFRPYLLVTANSSASKTSNNKKK